MVNIINKEKAINFFNKHGYLIINSMRQTGKTTVLRKIIELNQDKKIGILCHNHAHYTFHFNNYPNCEYISNLQIDLCGKHFDILIGDEVYLEPNPNIKTACAYTKRFVEHSLEINELLKEKIIMLKNTMSEHQFEIEFNQYL